MARLAIRGSQDAVAWLWAGGVRFQKALSGTLHLGRTNAFFLGGGRALVNALYRHGEGLGVVAHYEAEVDRVHLQAGACVGVTARLGGQAPDFTSRRRVFAAVGIQAQLPWPQE